MNNPLNLEKFKEALALLDKYIKEDPFLSICSPPMCIKAIGGFALLYHGIRSEGYTVDIDSVTDSFLEEQITLIERVAAELDLPKDWINNYNVIENVEAINDLLDPFWCRAEFDLKFIDLWVADLETLLKSKMMAAEDDHLTGRIQDFPDLIDIFRKLGLEHLDEIERHMKQLGISIKKEYPRNTARIQKAISAGKLSNIF